MKASEQSKKLEIGFNTYDQLAHFSIAATKISPAVHLVPDKQYLVIKGRSCQENPLILYGGLKHALNKYAMLGKERLMVYVKLEYFNTSSAKCIYNLFKRMQYVSNRGIFITINWYYEIDDEDMLEFGRDFQDAFDLKFNLISY